MTMPMKEFEFNGTQEAEVDSRRRISLGRVGYPEHKRYRIQQNQFGEILLTPVVSIPAREVLVWENTDVRAALARGIRQAEEGQLVELGSFAAYAEDDED